MLNGILYVRDPVTGKFVPIPTAKGPKGDPGPPGKPGVVDGFYASKNEYSLENCVRYCTDITSWNPSEIAESQGPEWQKPGSLIQLAIKCNNGDVYVSYQEIVSSTTLKPLSYWVSKKGETGPVGPVGPDGKPGKDGIGVKPWRLIGTGTATGVWGVVEFKTDTNGQPLSLKDVILYGVASGKKWMRLNGSKHEVWGNVSHLVEIVPGMQMYNFDGIKRYYSGDSITSVGLEFADAGEGTTVTVYGRDA